MSTYFCTPCDREHTTKEFNGDLCNDYIFYESKKSIIRFAQFFFPGDFVNKVVSPAFHYEMADMLQNNRGGAMNMFVVPRGFGKSVVMKAAIMHRICFNPPDQREFIFWLCETLEQATGHLAWMRAHIAANADLKKYFGDLYNPKKDTEKAFMTSRGDLMFALGMAQKPRGRSHIVTQLNEDLHVDIASLRYTLGVLDDFESELNTKTPEHRKANKDLVKGGLFPSLEETPGREGDIWFSGTIVHYGSFLQEELDLCREAEKEGVESPWKYKFFRATNDGQLTEDSRPLWPKLFPVKKLINIKLHKFRDSPDGFAREFMNDARDVSTAPVKIDRIQFHQGEYIHNKGFNYLLIDDEAIPVHVYIGMDPAGSDGKRADLNAIVVLAVDADRNWYILEIYNERGRAFDLIPLLYELAVKYHPTRVNIETGAQQGIYKNAIDEYGRGVTKIMPGIFKGIPPPTKISKEDKLIDSLSPVVNGRRLYVRRRQHQPVIDQLFELPYPKKDDLLDALYLAGEKSKTRKISSKKFPKKLMGLKSMRVAAPKKSWREPLGRIWRTG